VAGRPPLRPYNRRHPTIVPTVAQANSVMIKAPPLGMPPPAACAPTVIAAEVTPTNAPRSQRARDFGDPTG